VLQLATGGVAQAQSQLAAAELLYPRSRRSFVYAIDLYARAVIELYGDDGDRAAAWRRMRGSWSTLRPTTALRQQTVRVDMWDLRGRAALAALAGGDAPRGARRDVERAIARLARERADWTAALQLMLRSGLALLDGERATATTLLARAAAAADAADMALHAAVARRRLHALSDAGGDWFAAQQIPDPDRLTRLLLPVEAPA
jgi:hypothetical protein